MGLFWDLIQHGQINEAHSRTDSLEDRVSRLEDQLMRTNETLIRLLQAMEQRFGEDINRDGRVG